MHTKFLFAFATVSGLTLAAPIFSKFVFGCAIVENRSLQTLIPLADGRRDVELGYHPGVDVEGKRDVALGYHPLVDVEEKRDVDLGYHPLVDVEEKRDVELGYRPGVDVEEK